MDPREKLLRDVTDIIRQEVPIVAHVGLYNQDIDYMQEDAPWERPAVFLEFGAISWEQFKPTDFGTYARGTGVLRLHVVTDWYEDAYHASFQLEQDIWDALRKIKPCEEYQVRYPDETHTNHDHGEILENIDVFRVKYLKMW